MLCHTSNSVSNSLPFVYPILNTSNDVLIYYLLNDELRITLYIGMGPPQASAVSPFVPPNPAYLDGFTQLQMQGL